MSVRAGHATHALVLGAVLVAACVLLVSAPAFAGYAQADWYSLLNLDANQILHSKDTGVWGTYAGTNYTTTLSWPVNSDYGQVSYVAPFVNTSYNYAMKATGKIHLTAGTMYFSTGADDGTRLWIDLNKDSLFDDLTEVAAVADYFKGFDWHDGGAMTVATTGWYDFLYGWFQAGGGAEAHLAMKSGSPFTSDAERAADIVTGQNLELTPEPATLSLLALGGLLAFRRRWAR
jgi:hypothetical protein